MSGEKFDPSTIVAYYEQDTGRLCACGCGSKVYAIRETKLYASRSCRSRQQIKLRNADSVRKAAAVERAAARARADAERRLCEPEVEEQPGRPSLEDKRYELFGDLLDFAPRRRRGAS